MKNGMLEHVNVTVSDPDKTAAMLCELFGWEIRWQGPSLMDGRTIHVGLDDSYLALFSYPETKKKDGKKFVTEGGLNHIGVVVDDIDATEQKVVAAGFEPNSHADYEPGRRFYFYDHDDIEFEVVSYS